MLAHIPAGILDRAWGGGATAALSGPYSDAAPEADAAGLQALKSLAEAPAAGISVAPGAQPAAAAATSDAFQQLDGPRGGAYLLLADAAHPSSPSGPYPLDPTPTACSTPPAGPECLRRQVSDGLLAAWYASDTKMFFKVGETSTAYRPVDAIAVGCALVVAGFQLHDENKIAAGAMIVSQELRTDIDPHFGLLYGLSTATSHGGHTATDYHTHLADQAGAAEALLEAFDASREQQYMADAKKLLQPLMDESVALRSTGGGYIDGFDLQATGPAENTPVDVLATVLTLQAAHHYDRDDGGHFAQLEEAAAATLLMALDADRRAGGDPAAGLPARLTGATTTARSGLTTAIAVTVLGDLLRDAQVGAASPSPSL